MGITFKNSMDVTSMDVRNAFPTNEKKKEYPSDSLGKKTQKLLELHMK